MPDTHTLPRPQRIDDATRDAFDGALHDNEKRNEAVRRLLVAHPDGLTTHELADLLGLHPYVVAPRVTYWHDMGKVASAGRVKLPGMRCAVNRWQWQSKPKQKELGL